MATGPRHQAPTKEGAQPRERRAPQRSPGQLLCTLAECTVRTFWIPVKGTFASWLNKQGPLGHIRHG